MSYTFSILELSPSAYAEIREKLIAAGYADAVMDQGDGEVIAMNGIAVRAETPKEASLNEEDDAAHVVRGYNIRWRTEEAAREKAYDAAVAELKASIPLGLLFGALRNRVEVAIAAVDAARKAAGR